MSYAVKLFSYQVKLCQGMSLSKVIITYHIPSFYIYVIDCHIKLSYQFTNEYIYGLGVKLLKCFTCISVATLTDISLTIVTLSYYVDEKVIVMYISIK